MYYEKHVFICTNDKPAPKKCCGSEHGMALVEAFKAKWAESGNDQKIRIQKSGCLDFCGKGPSMVVYPEGVFYGNVQLEDVAEITEKHLIGNEIVSRLEIG
ncbi:(2Fe-2S) ferredoxin domain-containing protein [Aquirufa nivalisilvae]|jgi:(2Fe-2S) ferredoxin|uniref:NADH:ubiquinone reductase (H(+)-translocating) n=1 Tax=Aquirufa nivalisilvae TaxID=2516557 RepID=A0A2S2DZI9_9BACT|nr:(2Fe-2S) ferredoxin domain-containing protein [Aquirufa nivalisilvae]AWL10177.1 NADH:ubiquinone reductase (H(+)-translocating) [Aquirufa nivalisilvae]MCZ2479927.1 (2Fe-2S) ferredoxin domain-containing protein [Aquirufa nivalisilvae]